jgi:nucleoid-associated protein YgaU
MTFTQKVWETLLPVVDNDYPSMRIVGWYHTHPGFGLFLSEQDQFSHRSFFSDPRMVALVVDPKAGEAGWFGYDGDEIVELSRSRTATPASSGAAGLAAPKAQRRSRGGAAVLVAAVLAVVGFAAGYGLAPSGSSGTSAADRSAVTALTVQRDQERAAAEQVRRQLAAAQHPATAPVRSPVAGRAATRVVTYRVRAGDTLSALAVSFYGNPRFAALLAKANKLANPDQLNAGGTLVVPAG